MRITSDHIAIDRHIAGLGHTVCSTMRLALGSIHVGKGVPLGIIDPWDGTQVHIAVADDLAAASNGDIHIGIGRRTGISSRNGNQALVMGSHNCICVLQCTSPTDWIVSSRH